MVLRGIAGGGAARIADPCTIAVQMPVNGNRRPVSRDQRLTSLRTRSRADP